MLKTDMVFEVLLWALNVIAALLCVANFYHQRYEDETAIPSWLNASGYSPELVRWVFSWAARRIGGQCS